MAKGDQLYWRALKEAEKRKPKWSFVKEGLEKSLNLGNPKAAYALGTWYLHGRLYKKDVKKATELLKIAADKNIAEANFDLAVSYEKGIGIKKDLREAFMHYLKAYRLGDNDAAYEVGRCYYYGIGIKADKAIGRIWLNGKSKDVQK